jgi:DNA polymerase III epsilon subunit-like protein
VTWWNGRMAAFDLETTAANPEEARIVAAAVVLVGAGAETDSTTWLADPGIEIPEEAAEVHGITTERAQAEGDRPPTWCARSSPRSPSPVLAVRRSWSSTRATT